jgi:hypothetical protein
MTNNFNNYYNTSTNDETYYYNNISLETNNQSILYNNNNNYENVYYSQQQQQQLVNYNQNYYSNFNNNYYYQTNPESAETETDEEDEQDVIEPIINKNNNIDSIESKLKNESLWNKFNVHTTEMILTKQGRKMFPSLQYTLNGLDINKKYLIYIDMIQVVSNSWKYQSNKWIKCQLSDNNNNNELLQITSAHLHPDSPQTGSFWMKNEILFSKLKLTNNKLISNENNLLLNSMHKYVPRLHVVCLNDNINISNKKPKLSSFDKNDVKTFIFNQTQFIAVTAYLNRTITDLKIEYNPFAKGFRDLTNENNNNSFRSTNSSPINSPNINNNNAKTSTPKLNQQQQLGNNKITSPTATATMPTNYYYNNNNQSISYNFDYSNNSNYGFYLDYSNYSGLDNNTGNISTNYSVKRKYNDDYFYNNNNQEGQDYYYDNYLQESKSKHHCSNNYNILNNNNCYNYY